MNEDVYGLQVLSCFCPVCYDASVFVLINPRTER